VLLINLREDVTATSIGANWKSSNLLRFKTVTNTPVVNLFDDEVCVCGSCLDGQDSGNSTDSSSNPGGNTGADSGSIAHSLSKNDRLSQMKDSILAMQWVLVGLQNEEVPHAFLNEERLDGYSPAQMAKLEEEWLRSEGQS